MNECVHEFFTMYLFTLTFANECKQSFNFCNCLSFGIFFSSFRLEKEYTTIKTKEMEEQVEIKVCKYWSIC